MCPRYVTPREALDELLTQHASLRAMMERCDRLADELDAGSDSPQALLRSRRSTEALSRCSDRFSTKKTPLETFASI